MLNTRLLKAWPNYLLIPAIAAFWVITGALIAELLGAAPYHAETPKL